MTNNSANYNPTNHAIQIGATNGGLASLSVASTGKILQANTGADPTFSTSTYPSIATSTGTILRADGTNWVASTATYPDTAGTSGNVLTSDGTNWVSSAAPSAGSTQINISNGTTNTTSSTTYYIYDNGFTGNIGITAIMIPVTCTLDKVYGYVTCGTGSAENVTFSVRLNNTTDTTISSTWQWNVSPSPVNATGLGISLSAGDYINLKVVTPSWTSAPTAVGISISLYFTL